MTSIATDFLPIEIKPKAYYVHAKKTYLQHRLLDAAKILDNTSMKMNITN